MFVQIIQRHFGASAARLYAIGASRSTSGRDPGLDGPLVELASSLDPSALGLGLGLGGGNREDSADRAGAPHPHQQPSCPVHEAGGTSSMLLRRALVSRTAAVHKCGPSGRDSSVSRDATSHSDSTSAAGLGRGGGPVPSIDAARRSNGVGAAAVATALASYSSTASGLPEGYAAAAASGADGGGGGGGEGSGGGGGGSWCRNLDLCVVDAVPGSAMIFAAVPLAYGPSPFAVLWIALPYELPPPAVKQKPRPAAGPKQQQQRQKQRDGGGGGGGGDGGCNGTAPTPAAASADCAGAAATITTTTTTTTPAVQDNEDDDKCGDDDSSVPAREADDTVSCGGAVGNGGHGAVATTDEASLLGPVGLMSSPEALQHLALSASMALAAGLPDPQAHFSRLAACLKRIIGSGSLAELVGELCGALVRHVRHRFLVDAGAQAALVPAPDARVAFMLRPEHVETGGTAAGGTAAAAAAVASSAAAASLASLSGGHSQSQNVSNSFSMWAGRPSNPQQQLASQLQAQTLSRLRLSSVVPTRGSGGALLSQVGTERSRSVTASHHHPQQQHLAPSPSASASKRSKSNLGELPRAYATVDTIQPSGGGGGGGSTIPAAAAAAAAVAGAATIGGAPGAAPYRPWSVTTPRLPSVPREVFLVDGSNPRSDTSFAALSSSYAAVPPPTLSARAFRLSNTLLQAMIQAALGSHPQQQQQQRPPGKQRPESASAPRYGSPGSAVIRPGGGSRTGSSSHGQGGSHAATAPAAMADAAEAAQAPAPTRWVTEGGVLPGVCVCDCARHVQDERQPNRDVCMLMMATAPSTGAAGSGGPGTYDSRVGSGGPGAGYASAGWGIQGFGTGRAAGGGGGGLASAEQGGGGGGGGGGGSGAQSLVLLGLEMGDGAVLGVYLGFPTPTPQKLLEGVRDSCQALLAKTLADLVRHRLRCPDLAAEYDILRAGVPGSYLSISRASAVPAPDRPSPIGAAAVGAVHSGHAGTGAGAAGATPPLSPRSAGGVAPALRSSTVCSITEDGGFDVHQEGSTLNLNLDRSSSRQRLDLPSAGGATSGRRDQQLRGGSGPVALLSPGGGGGTAAGAGAADGGSQQHRGPQLHGRDKASLSSSHCFLEDAATAAANPRAHGCAAAHGHGPGPGPGTGPGSRTISGRAFQVITRLAGRSSTGPSDAKTSSATAGAATPAADGSPLDSGAYASADGGGAKYGKYGGAEEDAAAAAAAGGGGYLQDGPGGAGGPAPGAAAAAMLTVHDLDETYESWGMRAHMSALVDSIISTTLRSSGAHCRVDETGQGADLAAARVTEGLDELQLSAVLGQGASGVVLRGLLGCAPVAVKIMEMPDADASSLFGKDSNYPTGSGSGGGDDANGSSAADGGGGGAGAAQPGAAGAAATQARDGGDGGDGGGGLAGAAGAEGPEGAAGGSASGEGREVRARRALLRNAMEVAIMRSISHVNIVQAFGVYDNVIMERQDGRQGVINLRRINHQNHTSKEQEAAQPGQVPKSSPVCTAIVMQLCDRGSLADVLHARTFPALPLPPPHPSASPSATAGAAMQYVRYWRGVYMTLLEIALALRHLHSRRLVHRDLKPGNILLKSSPGDPRGWTCKLADFGFALVLDKIDGPDGSPASSLHPVPPASASNPHPLVVPPPSSNGGGGGPGGGIYAVQQHLGGTVTHMAPEAFRKGARIDASVDVFSFGVIMWELVSSRGHRPYRELELDAIGAAVTAGARPMFPPNDHVPLSYRQLARSCWSVDARLRPSAAELVAVVKGLLEGIRA